MKAGVWWKRQDVRGGVWSIRRINNRIFLSIENEYVFFVCVRVCLFFSFLAVGQYHTCIHTCNLFPCLCYALIWRDVLLIFFPAVIKFSLSFLSSDLFLPSAFVELILANPVRYSLFYVSPLSSSGITFIASQPPTCQTGRTDLKRRELRPCSLSLFNAETWDGASWHLLFSFFFTLTSTSDQ